MFFEIYNTIVIDNIRIPVRVFQQCEPDYLPAAPLTRHWTEDRQSLSDGQTQHADPFYSPERYQRYHSRTDVYTRAAQAASYTHAPETFEESGLFEEENLR